MAEYTANLDSVAADPANGNIVAQVTLTNGTRTVVRKIVANDLDRTIQNQVLRIVEELEAQDAAVASMLPGPIQFR